MDISNIKTTERVLEILHPATKEQLGIRVTLMSLDDDRMKKTKRQITDRRLHLEARGKHFKADEIDDNRNNIAFGAMTGWEWYEQKEQKDANGKIVLPFREQPKFNGKVPDFNRANVSAVFDQLSWFREQIEEAISETKDFF